MNADRKAALIAGVLFVTAAASGILSVVFSKPVLDAPDYLIKLSANTNQVTIGALLEFIMAAACAGIAIAMYPVLKRFNAGLALGSVGFRTIEGVLNRFRVCPSRYELASSSLWDRTTAVRGFRELGFILFAQCLLVLFTIDSQSRAILL